MELEDKSSDMETYYPRDNATVYFSPHLLDGLVGIDTGNPFGKAMQPLPVALHHPFKKSQ
jgi:hypothetical protein